ncbi:hypothetical protein N752_25180 [Desulforamulus aquiferis]|nr:hypothetical protein [Desulforamulus aquiferis]RYD02624.1 hypothetical protein N752_25180 [Desulforamulus aquiferis]
MSVWSGLGKVALGVGVIACAPIAVGIAASTAATVGAVAVTSGLATSSAVIGTGVTVCAVTDGSMYAIGSKIAADGVKETINSV